MKRAQATRHGPAGDRLFLTRQSLVERLTDLDDQRNWQDFFNTYWKLIYGVARKSGLTDAEAQDAVQETVITVAKNITKYERTAGSFKGWLLHITRWRIADQFRKRAPGSSSKRPSNDTKRGTATIDRLPAQDDFDLNAAWDQEWKQSIFEAALERLKKKVEPRHFQIFDCLVVKGWRAAKVSAELGVNIAQVYLVKHRLSALVKKEAVALEKHGR